MKKTLLIIGLTFLTVGLSAQSTFPKGIRVGKTSGVVEVDSVTASGVYVGATLLDFANVVLLADSTVQYVTPTQLITDSITLNNAELYRYYYSGAVFFRSGIRGGVWCLDKTLTPTGFAGSEDTDWTNLETHQ